METINELRDYIEECHDLKEAYKLGFWHDYFTSELIRCQNIHKLRTGSFHKLETLEIPDIFADLVTKGRGR